jgi:uncharacterized membrane protein
VPVAAGRPLIGKVRKFVDAVDDVRVVAAIRDAELGTTGQIRVHLSSRSTKDIEKAARTRFAQLNMADTPDRNAVLIYVQPRSRRFFIVGDIALDDRGGQSFWQSAAGALSAELSAGRYTEGLVRTVQRAGELLAEHFPKGRGPSSPNDLPDEVTED